MGIVLLWWFTILVIGVGFMPLTSGIFRKFEDRGWMFSKMLGFFLTGYLTWALNCTGHFLFTQRNCILITALLIAANYGIYFAITAKRRRTFQNHRAPQGEAQAAIFGDRQARRTIIIEEILFFIMFALWVYIIGFKPEAYGTEKFMDYGFMTAMTRSLTMPFEDMWYAGRTINYYYGGQYYATWLVKLTHVTTGQGYTLMRALITAMSFSLPFSLGYQLMRDKTRKINQSKRSRAPWLAAALSGCAVAFCGNFHYVIFGIIKPIIAKIKGEDYSFWFPDSTRYIGYNPDAPDKTIHEFPAYSSVLGDLHAHFINIIFVVTVIAIVYAWAQKVKKPEVNPFSHRPAGKERHKKHVPDAEEVCRAGKMPGSPLGSRKHKRKNADSGFDRKKSVSAAVKSGTIRQQSVNAAAKAQNGGRKAEAQETEERSLAAAGAEKLKNSGFTAAEFLQCISPEILLIGMMTGVFRWTNYWDMPIYYVTCGSILFFVNLRTYRKRPGHFIVIMGLEAVIMFVVGIVAALPFTSSFFMISSEVNFTHSHTPLYQLAILWGLPVACLIAFIIGLIKDKYEDLRLRRMVEGDCDDATEALAASEAEIRSHYHLGLSDLTVLMWGLCAAGLVFLPEVIYVKDIYGGDYYRANTMFKLTYQAFILFGICMGYIITRGLIAAKKYVRIFAYAGLVCLLLTGGYIFTSVNSWFGNIFKPSNRVNTDASVFVSESFSSDFGAISWLNTNVSGTPTILEAPGDSYSDYERVSVATGLPTVEGWYVHEWLWRQNTDEENQRLADIETIYTGTDEAGVRALIEEYDITYIYIGSLEREKYPALNDTLLQSIGETVYSDGETTYILKVK